MPIGECLDLHTFSPSEVASVVREYVEEASRAGLPQVRIIHGRGTGVQRQTVRNVLAGHPLVVEFRDAPPEAGGWGATVAFLRGREDATSGR